MYSQSIQKLIEIFSKFPGIGPRTAARFVFYLIGLEKEKVSELVEAISSLKENIKTCSMCLRSFEGDSQECPICSDPRRDKSLVCIVEKEIDLEAIEKAGVFKGTYFVLGGLMSGLTKKEKKKYLEERLDILVERISKGEVKEVILAINPTVEGEQTVLWLKRKLEPLKIKITQLGLGLPKGGELEYADQETLSWALKKRS